MRGPFSFGKHHVLAWGCLVRSVSTADGETAVFGHSLNKLLQNNITTYLKTTGRKICLKPIGCTVPPNYILQKQTPAGGIHIGQDLTFLLLFLLRKKVKGQAADKLRKKS